jgi:hypothetical protein
MSLRWRSGISAVVSLTCLGLIASASVPVSAATTPTSNNAIRITPTLSNITLSPGETSTTIDATVTNLTTESLHVGLSSRDFSASQTQAGAVQFYGAGYNASTNPHSLQAAINFPAPFVSLAPKQTQKVTITLSNLSTLASGGHYSAVLFNPEPATTGTSSNISIGSSVASLIFLTTANGGTDKLALGSFSIGLLHFSLPSTTNLAFQETGNTQTSPQGQLTLYGPNGSIVSTAVVNPGEGLVLPGTVRLFPTQLPLKGLKFARPGIYRLQLQYRSRTSTTFTTVSKRFLYINLAVIIPAIILFVLLIFVLVRYGSKLFAVIRWLYRVIRRLFKKKKQTPPPAPEKPKKPTRLIQG